MLFNFVLITAILCIIYLQSTKDQDQNRIEDDKDRNPKGDRDNYRDNFGRIADFRGMRNISNSPNPLFHGIPHNIDTVIFGIAQKNGGIVSIPTFCIESGLSAIEASNYLIKLEKQNFIFSSYSKRLSQIVYYVNEYLTEDNRRDLDLLD